MDATVERNHPLTPTGRLFLQPQINHVVNFAVAVEHPIDVDSFKTLIQSSIMLQNPRFCSLMVRDSCGREHWRKTLVDVDRHLIILRRRLSDDHSISNEDAVNDYMSDLSISSPLPTDKPLWEIHLLLAHKTAVFRVHHALGDGVSLMSMLQSLCRRAEDAAELACVGGGVAASSWRRRSVWRSVWYSLVFVLELALRGLWLRDKTTALSGGAGVELWPRRLATARFRLDDMKIVKQAIGDATTNDVLLGAISNGLSRYLDIRSTKALKEGTQITGVSLVNLRSQAGLQDISDVVNGNYETWWGNKIGMILVPLYFHRSRSGSNPLEFVKSAKTIMDKKKLSLEAPITYKLLDFIMSFLVPQLAGILSYRIFCNTTFTVSNIIGPRDEITLAGNLVKTIRLTSSSLPHAITMHMVSYAGMAEMQILVAKDIIPDPKVLANCFEDALFQMKQAAEAHDSSKSRRKWW